jgi:hypothetical protein
MEYFGKSMKITIFWVKSTISMAIFNSFLTRGYQIRWGGYGGREYGTSEMWIESQ